MTLFLLGGLALAQPSPAASRLVDTGHQEAAAGRWDSASRYYQQAHKAAPGWGQPLLGLGTAGLHLADLDAAGKWFGILSTLDDPVLVRAGQALGECVRREYAGEVGEGTCRTYAAARGDMAALEALVVLAPMLAPAWCDLALEHPDPATRAEALARGLASDPEPATWRILVVVRQRALVGGP